MKPGPGLFGGDSALFEGFESTVVIWREHSFQILTMWNRMVMTDHPPLLLPFFLLTPPSRPTTSVAIKYLSGGCIASSSASRLATHHLSGRRCHPTYSQHFKLYFKNPSFSSPFSTLGIEVFHRLLCLYTPPAFCCLRYPYSLQKYPYSSVSNLELEKS